MSPPICPLCNHAMQPDEVTPGVWRCPDDETHEFHEDADPEPLTARQQARRSKVHLPHGGKLCPRCRDTHMLRVTGTTGVWRCSSDETHEFMIGEPVAATVPALPPEKPSTWPDAPQITMATMGMPYFRYLQQSMGITGPISRAPQSNAGPGDFCLLTGPVAPGGGSKSGRRRKKTKGGKTFTDSPWGEGGTNSR